MTGKELHYINEAYRIGHFSGDGTFTSRCSKLLTEKLTVNSVLLTHSCTAALEMTALLINLNKGDEVIMPSFTFVSTANAFVLHGGKPVFVDIKPDTLNIDETKIEDAITEKTKALAIVHYAGIACNMDKIMAIVKKYNLILIEDAAHAIGCTYKGKKLGSFGTFATLSFHETKNIICGEGGALLINDPSYLERSEIIREKGTNRKKFLKGMVDKYTWVDIGSSYLPGELSSAFLWAQLEEMDEINAARLKSWNYYNTQINKLNLKDDLTTPTIPNECEHNGHLYYLLTKTSKIRDELIKFFKSRKISAIFHYIPLHSSPAGLKYCKTASVNNKLPVTEKISSCIVRLPMFNGISTSEQDIIIDSLKEFFGK